VTSSKKQSTKDLYTAADVKKVRTELLKEQSNKCAASGVPLVEKEAVLDHAHDENQFVRAVLHRQVNAFLGKAENAFDRLIKWWYKDDLPTLLRLCADYLENSHDTRYRHPGWIKKIKANFNKLNAKEQNQFLQMMQLPVGKNPKERKDILSKAILSREYSMSMLIKIVEEIREAKEDED
jgi:hypothetical protein